MRVLIFVGCVVLAAIVVAARRQTARGRLRERFFGPDHVGAEVFRPIVALTSVGLDFDAAAQQDAAEEAAIVAGFARVQAGCDLIAADALNHFRDVLDELAEEHPGLAVAFTQREFEFLAREVAEDTAEVVFEPAPRVIPTSRQPGKAERRRYHDERRLIGAALGLDAIAGTVELGHV